MDSNDRPTIANPSSSEQSGTTGRESEAVRSSGAQPVTHTLLEAKRSIASHSRRRRSHDVENGLLHDSERSSLSITENSSTELSKRSNSYRDTRSRRLSKTNSDTVNNPPMLTKVGALSNQVSTPQDDAEADGVHFSTGESTTRQQGEPSQQLIEAEIVQPTISPVLPVALAEPMSTTRKQRIFLGALIAIATLAVVLALTLGTNSTVQPSNITNPTWTDGTCGDGSRGDGVCVDGACCSQYGYCGTSSEHCARALTPPPTLLPPANYSSCPKIVGGYLPNWFGTDTTPPHKVDTRYNTVYLYRALPNDDGGVEFAPPYEDFYGDCQVARRNGRKLILTVGSDHRSSAPATRNESTAILRSIQDIIDEVGGVDGLDWNNFDPGNIPNKSEIVYVSQELKRMFGTSFLITAPVAPERRSVRDLAVEMDAAGVLDYVTPVFYDTPGRTDVDNIMQLLGIWTDLVGAEKVVVGLGVRDLDNFMTATEANATMQQVVDAYPNIRGATQWEVQYDAVWNANGFARSVAPLLCESL